MSRLGFAKSMSHGYQATETVRHIKVLCISKRKRKKGEKKKRKWMFDFRLFDFKMKKRKIVLKFWNSFVKIQMKKRKSGKIWFFIFQYENKTQMDEESTDPNTSHTYKSLAVALFIWNVYAPYFKITKHAGRSLLHVPAAAGSQSIQYRCYI